MKFKILAGLLLSASQLSAQENTIESCAVNKQRHFRAVAKTAVAAPAEEDYDVKYVKLDIAMSNVATVISGNVLTKAVARVPMSQYVFELQNALTVDSVKINGAASTVTTSGIVRTASIAAPLPAGASFTAQVWYHGAPPATTAGITTAKSPSWGNWVTYTLSESYEAKDWWPCKQSLQDKIDSSDVWITVADTLMAGSNGVLQNITSLPSNQKRYEWKSRYPIDYYLISAAVAKYVDYSYYVHFPGSTDSMRVQNYVYDNPQTLIRFQSVIDSVGPEILYYSDLFGRYPFWQEKYGHCMAPLGGGMEHQTMTTLGNFSGTVTPHELVHQWFGDYVTCATWKDIWLNEGFASYGEYLYLENFYGKATAQADMNSKHYNTWDGVTSATNGSVYVDDTTDENRIFSSRLTYNKGGSVVHMLRYLAPSDGVFFASLRAYLQHFAFGTAITDSFKTVVQPFYTRNLDPFINEWIYGEGHPVYDARWNATGGKVYVSLAQQGSAPQSVNVFHLPVEVLVSGPQGDTTIVVEMRGASELVSFVWNKPVSGITIDPVDWIPHVTNSVTQDGTLAVSAVGERAFSVAPNPSHTAWYLVGFPAGAWQLSDISGRLLAEGKGVEIGAANLPSGVYLLRVKGENGAVQTVRLLRD